MADIIELEQWEAGIYQLEEEDLVLGGPDGIDNLQAKQLANRTKYLKALVEALGIGKQPLDAMLTALAALATAADQTLYFTGEDEPALTPLTAYMRTVLGAANAAAARGLLDAVSSGELADAVAALVDASPGALDTLNELAAALADDPNFAATMTNALALKAPLASPALSGTPTAPTAAPGTNTDQLATMAALQAAIAALALDGYAKLAVANIFTKGQAGTVAALPATTGTLAFDFTGPSNISGQVTGDTVMGNGYTTHGVGKATWFSIRLQQDAATLRNWSFGSNWKHVGGNSLIPAQTQTLGAWDEIIGQVLTDGTISFAVRSNVS